MPVYAGIAGWTNEENEMLASYWYIRYTGNGSECVIYADVNQTSPELVNKGRRYPSWEAAMRIIDAHNRTISVQINAALFHTTG